VGYPLIFFKKHLDINKHIVYKAIEEREARKRGRVNSKNKIARVMN